MLDDARWGDDPRDRDGGATPSRYDDLDQRFYKARETFSAPRFKALYKVWKQDGDTALAEVGSHAISNAVEAGAGQVEALELGHLRSPRSLGCGCLT
jgi:hypothetical protein